MTNKDVKRAFMNKKPAVAANLVSTGDRLLSYGWWEVARWINGEVVIRKGRSYSQTTAGKHRPGVYGRLASEETPVAQGEMNI